MEEQENKNANKDLLIREAEKSGGEKLLNQ
jgi:hypothetical protein